MAAQIEVSQHWGESLLRVERFPASRRLTVGPAAKSDFVAALDAPTILVDAGAVHGNEGSVEIGPATDVEVGVGDVIFRVRAVEPERAMSDAIEIDWLMCAAVLAAAILSLAAMVVAVLAFFAVQLLRIVVALLIAMFGHPGFDIPMLMPLPIEPPPPAIVATAEIRAPAAAGPSRPFFERPTPTPIPTIKPIPIGDQPMTRLRAARRIETELLEERDAILGVLGSLEGSEMSSIFASGEIDSVAYGGLIGTAGVEMSGVSGGELRAGGGSAGIGGLGTAGTGKGGGGTALGIGGLGTRGRGVARVEKIEKIEPVEALETENELYEEGGIEGGVVGGVAGGVEGGVAGGVVGGVVGGVYGGTVVSNSPPPAGGPRGEIEVGMASLPLSREQIAKVVHQHIAVVQACYETGLRADPDLSGRVTLSWTVRPDGSVTNARVTSSTLGSTDVEACIARQVSKWRFPQPAGGGDVRVNYPFSFDAQ